MAEISDFDWNEIYGSTDLLGDVSVARDEVEEVLHQHLQMGDSGYAEMDLVAVLKLKDGTFASVHAGTDTTGWGCHGDYVRWYRGPTLEDVIYNGLTNESRDWLGLEIQRG